MNPADAPTHALPPQVAVRRALAVLLALVVVLAAAGSADARRVPTAKERTAILGTTALGCGDYPAGSCRFAVRISTVHRGWAAVYIRPRSGWENTVQSDVASMRRRSGRWRQYQLGNGGGCGVPTDVRRDLMLACY